MKAKNYGVKKRVPSNYHELQTTIWLQTLKTMVEIKTIGDREYSQMERDWLLVHKGRRGFHVQHCSLDGPDAIVTVSEPFADARAALGLAKSLALQHEVKTICLKEALLSYTR